MAGTPCRAVRFGVRSAGRVIHSRVRILLELPDACAQGHGGHRSEECAARRPAGGTEGRWGKGGGILGPLRRLGVEGRAEDHERGADQQQEADDDRDRDAHGPHGTYDAMNVRFAEIRLRGRMCAVIRRAILLLCLLPALVLADDEAGVKASATLDTSLYGKTGRVRGRLGR